MNRTRIATTLVACITLGVVLAGAAPAYAEDPATCTTPVVDLTEAHLLDVEQIEAAVNEANETGGNFFVRAFEEPPSGSLDAYWRESILNLDCPNWSSGPADNLVPKPNLVLIAFNMGEHPNVGLYYGSAYNDAIGDAGMTAILNEMVPYLKAEDFTEGVVVGLESAARMTDPNREAPVSGGEKPADPIVIDWGAVGTWLLYILGAIVFGILLWLFIRLNMGRIERSGARRALRSTRTEAGSAVANWEGLGAFTDITFLTGGQPLPKEAQSRDYDKEIDKATRRATSASGNYGRYIKLESHDPDRRLTVEEANEANHDYRQVTIDLLDASADLDALKVSAGEDAYRYSFEGQAVRVSSIRKALDTMSAKLGDYGSLFPTTVTSRKSQRLNSDLSKVEADLASKTNQLGTFQRLDDLDSELAELSEEFEQMREAARSLSNPRVALEHMIEDGYTRLHRLSVNTDEEELQLERLNGDSLDGVLRKLNATQSYERQMAVFDTFQRRVTTIVGRATSRDEAHRANEEKKRAAAAKKRRDADRKRERQYSNSSSSNDNLVGALVGGYVGASLGSSNHHSDPTPSYSPPSIDFGGGGSTGFGGGGDFGGGGSTGF